MNVAFNTAVSGMQVSESRLNVTAHNIANVNTPGYTEITANQVSTNPYGVRVADYSRTPNPSKSTSGTDLAQQMVNLKVDKNTFTANAKVVKMQDKMIGEVIDLIA